MLFRGRYDKQIERIKESKKDTQLVRDVEDVQNVMEKGDLPAMIISALLVILPVALLVLLVVSFIGYKFISH